MQIDEVLAELSQRGDPKMKAIHLKHGAEEPLFGVKLGEIRTLGKQIKSDHALGLQLWQTGILDARYLATLILKPKQLSVDEIERMANAITYPPLFDWLMTQIIKVHPTKEAMREAWMQATEPMLARGGWSLTSELIAKKPDSLNLGDLLDRIERELLTAPAPTQWTMNMALATIGIESPAHRQRALTIGETLGVYRDYPTSKGCTSPFAPLWINEMVRRAEG